MLDAPAAPRGAPAARILAIPNEFPLPANSGGRIDVWRRLSLLHDMGCDLALLTWYDEPREGRPGPALMEMAQRVCHAIHLAPIRRSPGEIVRRLAHAGRLPSHAASRWVSLPRAEVLAWAADFRPDLILLDGLYGAAVARWLSARLGVPWLYRSHNVEHQYMRLQMARATHWRQRLGLLANVAGLEALERSTILAAAAVLDISEADAAFWRSQGAMRVSCLPPLVDTAFAQALAGRPAAADVDALYFGNLNTPNNVDAVRWLVTQVLPALPSTRFKLVLAGSRPGDEVRRLAAADDRIELLPDPADMAAVVRRARVLLNPVQAGSGVNLKSVEMLFSHAWLLSTPTGVQGLPDAAAACFEQHAQAPAFAAALGRLLQAGEPPPPVLAQRQHARARFEPVAAARLLGDTLRACLPAPPLEEASHAH